MLLALQILIDPPTRNCSRRLGIQKQISALGAAFNCSFFSLRASLTTHTEPSAAIFRQTTDRARGAPFLSIVASVQTCGASANSSLSPLDNSSTHSLMFGPVVW